MAWPWRRTGRREEADEARDLDQARSELSETHRDAGQPRADADQAPCGHELEARQDPFDAQADVHDASQHHWSEPTPRRENDELERILVDVQRAETAAVRDDVARERDHAAELRDGAARRSDAALLASDPGSTSLRAVVASNTERRDKAVEDRRRAASDRERAAEDRITAAAGQRQARIDIQRAQLDGLTGAYARELGHVTLRSEIDRCRRSDDPFVLALIRVDAPFAIHTRYSRSRDDALVQSVVAVLRDKLRSYDPVVRVSDGEFLCALPGSAADDAHQRVEEIRTTIEHHLPPAAISVGYATLTSADTLGSLIDRASADLPST